jgi:hypothetical protein
MTTTTRRHPVLGLVAGFLLGLGVAIMLVIYGVVPIAPLIVAGLLLGGAALGLALAYLAPTRHRAAV